jgi:hypothetical protein
MKMRRMKLTILAEMNIILGSWINILNLNHIQGRKVWKNKKVGVMKKESWIWIWLKSPLTNCPEKTETWMPGSTVAA